MIEGQYVSLCRVSFDLGQAQQVFTYVRAHLKTADRVVPRKRERFYTLIILPACGFYFM